MREIPQALIDELHEGMKPLGIQIDVFASNRPIFKAPVPINIDKPAKSWVKQIGDNKTVLFVYNFNGLCGSKNVVRQAYEYTKHGRVVMIVSCQSLFYSDEFKILYQDKQKDKFLAAFKENVIAQPLVQPIFNNYSQMLVLMFQRLSEELFEEDKDGETV
jgi:hypothetical protein